MGGKTYRTSLGLVVAIGLWHSQAFGACQIAKLAELPVNMVGLRPTVMANINGTDAVFVLDSGAFFSMMTPAAAEQFKLPLDAAPVGLRIGGIGGQVKYSVATVDNFTFAGFRLRKVQFIVGGNEVGGNAVGLLGQNILRAADIEYDLANGVIRLMQPTGCDNVVMVYWNKDAPYSEINIEATSPVSPQTFGVAYLNGKKIRVMFDTGAHTSVLTLRAAERAGVKPGDPGVTAAGYAYGIGQGAVASWIGHFASFKIGAEETRNARLRFGDLGPSDVDMLLGVDFFLAHHLYVASSKNKLYFTYNGGPVFDLTASGAGTPASASVSGAPTAAAAQTPASGAAPAAPAAPAAGDEPTDAAGYGLRGAALAARGDYARAIAELTRACQLDPKEPRYFEQRGLAELRLKQTMQALADFDQAIDLKPDDATALMARAELRFTARDRPGAVADLDAVDRAVPKEADVRLTLAAGYLRAAQYGSAASQYDQWIAAHGGDIAVAVAMIGRCRARALSGEDLRRALGDCNAAVRASSGDAMRAAALDSRGLVRLRQGDYARCLDDYNTALHLQPRRASALYGRGLAELRQGHAAAAHADMQAAAVLQPRITDDFQRIGIGP